MKTLTINDFTPAEVNDLVSAGSKMIFGSPKVPPLSVTKKPRKHGLGKPFKLTKPKLPVDVISQ